MSALPDFFLIGAAKSGTSALFELLCGHPGVLRPGVKEPMYFALGGRPPSFAPPSYGELVRARAIWREEEYLALFAEAGERLSGEASTLYLNSPEAAQALRRSVPDARLIAILRDPVERAHSAFTHLRRDGHEPLGDFAAALAAEPERIEMGYAPMWHYRRRSCYGDDLERYLGLFPREQLLLLRYEDFAANPNATVERAWSFLGLDPGPGAPPVPRINAGGETRSRSLRRLLIGDNAVKRASRRVLPPRTRQLIWRALMRRNVKPLERDIPAAVELELRAYYAPDVERVEEITGWDLRAWKSPAAITAGGRHRD